MGVFTLLCLPQFEEFLSMSSMLFLAFPCGFPPLFLPGEPGYMPVRQWRPSLPFFCVLSIELLRSGSPPASSGPMEQKSHTGYASGEEHDGALRRAVQRPGVMSEPSSGSPQSPGSPRTFLVPFIHLFTLPAQVPWDRRKWGATLLPPYLFVS